jgi:hypothetical protein
VVVCCTRGANPTDGACASCAAATSVFHVMARVCLCGADVLSRWKPVSDKPTPAAIQNVARTAKSGLDRLDTFLRAARFWLLLGRAASQPDGDVNTKEAAACVVPPANAAVDAVQAYAVLISKLSECIPGDDQVAHARSRLMHVTGAAARTPTTATADDTVIVTIPEASVTKKRSRWEPSDK